MVLPLQGSGAGDLRLPPNEAKPHKYSSTKPASWTSLRFYLFPQIWQGTTLPKAFTHVALTSWAALPSLHS